MTEHARIPHLCVSGPLYLLTGQHPCNRALGTKRTFDSACLTFLYQSSSTRSDYNVLRGCQLVASALCTNATPLSLCNRGPPPSLREESSVSKTSCSPFIRSLAPQDVNLMAAAVAEVWGRLKSGSATLQPSAAMRVLMTVLVKFSRQ